MHGIARISFSGGARLMPARNGYDRELVFEEAECCARRHGEVRLELGRAALLVRAAGGLDLRCARCDRAVDRLAFAFGPRSLCPRCARLTAR